ncbi:MAG: carbon monoxide dehydrogenase subunit G [Myxococcota bacterium]|nr:carbon monoxide dehydrogenase subunit G [Myxococcota bacterium]
MKVEGREKISIAVSDAWRGVNDPSILRACTPGLTRLDETSPDQFEATLELKLPAVSGRFEGRVVILERDEPSRLKLQLEGKGGPGFVNGEAELHFGPDGDGTAVHFEANVQVGGQIARLGQRMISGVTKEMAGQFFEALERVAAPGGTAAEDGGVSAPTEFAPNPLSSFLKLAWRTLLNLLGLSKRS